MNYSPGGPLSMVHSIPILIQGTIFNITNVPGGPYLTWERSRGNIFNIINSTPGWKGCGLWQVEEDLIRKRNTWTVRQEFFKGCSGTEDQTKDNIYFPELPWQKVGMDLFEWKKLAYSKAGQSNSWRSNTALQEYLLVAWHTWGSCYGQWVSVWLQCIP